MPQRTYGEAPRYRYGAGAVVHNDTMYLMCGTSSGPDKDYRVVQQKFTLKTNPPRMSYYVGSVVLQQR